MKFDTSLRNRIVGSLCVASLVVILIPFLSDSNDSSAKNNSSNAIAITKNGAMTDESGQLVSASSDIAQAQSEHDYSDLLAPVDDTPKTTDVSPFDALKQNDQQSNTVQSVQIEPEEPVSATTTIPDTNRESTNTREVLKSSRKSAKPNASTEKISQPKVNSALASGMYAAQVGVFSKKANVEALVSVLNSKGFKTISQNININGKAMIRVFAGTSKTREGALAICNKVKKNTKEQCRIVAL